MQFAVLYEARSNTGIDRMKIINAVAKSVPQPHKVDLSSPDRTIIVQIAKVNDFILNALMTLLSVMHMNCSVRKPCLYPMIFTENPLNQLLIQMKTTWMAKTL